MLRLSTAQIFPPSDASARLLRFILATRPIVLLGRSRRETKAAPADVLRGAEDELLTQLLAIGAVVEAGLAFADAEAAGVFRDLFEAVRDKYPPNVFRLGESVHRRLKRACDRSEAAFLERAKKIRDAAAFHWSRERVKEVLTDFDRDASVHYHQPIDPASSTLDDFLYTFQASLLVKVYGAGIEELSPFMTGEFPQVRSDLGVFGECVYNLHLVRCSIRLGGNASEAGAI